MKKNKFFEASFNSFASLVSERKNPKPGDESNYIGLEHMTPNRLHITNWGGDIELKGQKFAIKKGDILFAKRNAYLKRVSIAPIDGIFSAHGMVFRPSGTALADGFLPYFLLSRIFWDRAISISEGSLSPTIKWGTLARQKFVIPDIETQNRSLKMLKRLTKQEKLINESLLCIDNSIRLFRKKVFDNYFDILLHKRASLPPSWKYKRISEILLSSPTSGNSINVVDRETHHYVLNLNCLTRYGFSANGYKTIEPDQFQPSLKLNQGDLLISRSNTIDLVGLVGIYRDDENRKAIFPDTMWRLDVNEDVIDKEFLLNYLLSPYARREIQRIAAGSSGSMKKINKTEFGKVLVPVPPIKEQQEINRILLGFEKTRHSLIQKQERVCSLRLSLINVLLEGSE
ncbi:restriction endonuclease subunit S [Aeromonas veronii]